MKKFLAIALSAAFTLSLTGCGGSKKAFEVSKAAYDNIDIAYVITDNFGSDIYEAWRLGIYDDEEVIDEGTTYLAGELSLSKEELDDGVVYILLETMGSSWEDATNDEKSELRASADSYFRIFEDDLFSFCVMVVTGAYQANGKVAEAQSALEAAKSQMKELSEKYSDYEHYPNLKGYYTTTNAFFDFCLNPTGSFEQIKTTINDYRNEARDYVNDLDYIFEE